MQVGVKWMDEVMCLRKEGGGWWKEGKAVEGRWERGNTYMVLKLIDGLFVSLNQTTMECAAHLVAKGSFLERQLASCRGVFPFPLTKQREGRQQFHSPLRRCPTWWQ